MGSPWAETATSVVPETRKPDPPCSLVHPQHQRGKEALTPSALESVATSFAFFFSPLALFLASWPWISLSSNQREDIIGDNPQAVSASESEE